MDKGLKILLDCYWASGGWKREDEQSVSSEDFAIAKSEGYMFVDSPKIVSHRETIDRIKNILTKITPYD